MLDARRGSSLLRPGTAAAAPNAHRKRRANNISAAVSFLVSSSQSPLLAPSFRLPALRSPTAGAALRSQRFTYLPATRASTKRHSLQSAPSLVADDDNAVDEKTPPSSSKIKPPRRPPPLSPPPPPRWAKSALVSLSSLPLAISELALIAALSAVGTVIEQNKGIEYYRSSYPVGAPGLGGLLDFRVITFLGWDHVYSSLPFLGLCALLAASLAACTSTRQAPALRVAQSWRFAKSEDGVYVHARGAKKQGAFASASVLTSARARDLGRILASKGYQVFVCDNDNAEKENEKVGRGGGSSSSSSSSSSSLSSLSTSTSTSAPSSSPSSVSLYAFKGLAGKVGPIVVHASLLLTIAGAAAGALGGWRGNALVPVGGEFAVIEAISPASPVSVPPSGARQLLRVDGFNVVYRDDGSVAQFESDLSVLDPATGAVAKSQRISVNKPLRFGGVTAYQADYGMAALTLRVAAAEASPESAANAAAAAKAASSGASGGAGGIGADGSLVANSAPSPASPPKSSSSSSSSSAAFAAQPFNLPFAEIQDAGGIKGRAWATFLPTGPGGGGAGGGAAAGGGGGNGGGASSTSSATSPPPSPSSPSSSSDNRKAIPPKGITLLARDFQTVVVYDSKGAFAGVRRPGSGRALTVEGVDLLVDDVVGSSGVELKADPGVPVVYAGFAGLMVSTLVSYLSHSQVWAWQSGEDGRLHVSGRTNRAALGFERELEGALAEVPEVP